MNCRHCGKPLVHPFLDLGFAPPSNAYLTREALSRMEPTYPLRLRVCDGCWLVQTEDYADAGELFSADYAYFSSTSPGWVAHAGRYAKAMTERLSLGRDSLVIEVASNDGYLLRHFVEVGIPCLGIEPTDSTAAAAEALGIPVRREFFGEALGCELAARGQQADLIVGNNVFAHVPDINDFSRGLAAALKPTGTLTLEFPHLLQMLREKQFDTAYHEHFSYLSLFTTVRILGAAGLTVVDVDRLGTHGGSLRVHAQHAGAATEPSPAVAAVLSEEAAEGLQNLAIYATFQAEANRIKRETQTFLLEQVKAGRRVVAYGAAAKGNTLLNFAGVRPDLLECVCDAAPAKQGKYLPGSHIPIRAPQAIYELRPDFIWILPWNLRAELTTQLSDVRQWGGKFMVAVPRLEIWPA